MPQRETLETESCLQTNTQNRRESKRNTKPTQTNINKKHIKQNKPEYLRGMDAFGTANGTDPSRPRSEASVFDSYYWARSLTVLPSSSERRKIRKGNQGTWRRQLVTLSPTWMEHRFVSIAQYSILSLLYCRIRKHSHSHRHLVVVQ